MFGKKPKRQSMPYKKDKAVFRHSAVTTKKVNVNPYAKRGGDRF